MSVWTCYKSSHFISEMKAREKKVTFDEEVEVKTIEAPEVVEINGDLMDQCLTGLQNADPTEERPDPQELLVLEGEVTRSKDELCRLLNSHLSNSHLSNSL